MQYEKAGKVFMLAGLIFLISNIFSIPINNAQQELQSTIETEMKVLELEELARLGIEKSWTDEEGVERDTDEYSDWLYSSGRYPRGRLYYKATMQHWLASELFELARIGQSRVGTMTYLLTIGIALYVVGKKK